MDERKKLIKQKALNQFADLLDNTTLKVSVWGITVKPIHGQNNIKRVLLNEYEKKCTVYLAGQASKEIFKAMNDYMYQATGELAWYRSSSYWVDLLTDQENTILIERSNNTAIKPNTQIYHTDNREWLEKHFRGLKNGEFNIRELANKETLSNIDEIKGKQGSDNLIAKQLSVLYKEKFDCSISIDQIKGMVIYKNR